MEHGARRGYFDNFSTGQGHWRLANLAIASASEFSSVFRRPKYFIDWHLDDSPGDKLAGLPADWLRFSTRGRGFTGKIPTFLFAPFPGV